MERSIVVAKFGGSVLKGAEDYLRAAEIVDSMVREGVRVVMVVSALKGVTDAILDLLSTHPGDVSSGLSRIAEAYRRAAAEALDSPYFEDCYLEMSRLLDELAKTLWAVSILGEATPRVRDHALSYGEKMSALLMSYILRSRGLDSEWLTGGKAGLVTTREFGGASPIVEEAYPRIRKRIGRLLEKGLVPVVTGFIGETMQGETTTLGRGGSDYSATIIGSALDAVEVRLYTDVEGVLTADPRMVSDAETIPLLSVEEAMELSYLGAKKFHPRTFEPLKASGTAVRILSAYNPRGPSTLVKGTCSDGSVKAVTLTRDLAIVNVKGPTMVGRIGTAAKVMALAWREDVNISAISQPVSETLISVAVRSRDAERFSEAIRAELVPKGIVEEVEVISGVGAATVVGCGLMRTEEAGRIMELLKGFNVYSVSRGPGGVSISILTPLDEAVELVRRIHSEVVKHG